MPIHFICPHCGVATDTAEKFAGQEGPCANCGAPITIPTPKNKVGDRAWKKQRIAIGLGVVLLGLAGLGFAMLWGVLPAAASKKTTRRMSCVSNLRRIAVAMQNYETINGSFPPAYVADKRGKPMHSWRALLLPYLDQDLADQYHFDEPWDSVHNRDVTELTIGLFQCPAQPSTRAPTTNYMMVVGPHTISDGSGSVRIANITDGLAETIMLVEVADSTIRWAEPEDLTFDKLRFIVNARNRPGGEISSHHPGGANVVFCAGHSERHDDQVRFLKNSTNPYLVRAMLTIDGSEPVTASEDH
jgi:hypothetical protein